MCYYMSYLPLYHLVLFIETDLYVLLQASVHLVEEFQRRRLKCEKLTDDRRRTPSDGKSSHCLWQDELKISLYK
jgi:hypothetical protein